VFSLWFGWEVQCPKGNYAASLQDCYAGFRDNDGFVTGKVDADGDVSSVQHHLTTNGEQAEQEAIEEYGCSDTSCWEPADWYEHCQDLLTILHTAFLLLS